MSRLAAAQNVVATEPARRVEPAWIGRTWIAAVLVLTALLHTIAFPPFNIPEAAYVFAAPIALWCARRPRWRIFVAVAFGASWVSWLVLLEWLHHVTWAGTFALAAVMACFTTAWFAGVRAALPRVTRADHGTRVLALVGLAGLWVVIEWVRGWFLTGFPWLPLAASQWQRPVLLQVAAYAGAGAVSFILVFFNLGLAAYLHRLRAFVRERQPRWCPEFYLALGVLAVCAFGLFGEAWSRRPVALFRAGFMQPYIPQNEKWDSREARAILEVIRQQTTRVAAMGADVIFGPEAVTPLALLGDPDMQAWTEQLARDAGAPLVLGALAIEPAETVAAGGEPANERWSNAVFLVTPDGGLERAFYRKRHLVPFGEYVPLRRFFPNVAKFVPIGGDFQPGADAAPLALHARDAITRIGALICYEDVFASLARDAARAGADVLFVATNDAWYGETGGAYQHAAHSVLRAVETRRPVLRAGNGGWSGWIDEFGVIRDVVLDERGSVYHRGGGVALIRRDERWIGRDSLYVRWGDWFIGVCAALALAAAFVLRRRSAAGFSTTHPH